MEQFVALIRRRDWEEDGIWTDYFIVEKSDNPEQHFRNAVKEYLLTEDGAKQIKWTNNDFNWGDSIMFVPYEIWNKHGIRPVNEGDTVMISSPFEIIVDQDEVLIPDEFWDREA